LNAGLSVILHRIREVQFGPSRPKSASA
jgi:hypothetical protein